METAQAASQLPDALLHAAIDYLPITGSDRFRTTRDAMTMKRIGIGNGWRPGTSGEFVCAREFSLATAIEPDTKPLFRFQEIPCSVFH